MCRTLLQNRSGRKLCLFPYYIPVYISAYMVVLCRSHGCFIYYTYCMDNDPDLCMSIYVYKRDSYRHHIPSRVIPSVVVLRL